MTYTLKTQHSLLSASLLLLGIISCSKPEKSTSVTPSSNVPEVRLQRAGKSLRTLQQAYSGTIEAENYAALSFSVNGLVKQVLVHEGDIVRAGQVLAIVDDEEYRSLLDGAEATLTEARDAANRSEQLYNSKSLTERELVLSNTALKRAEASAQINRKHLRDTKLLAPFSGIVAARSIEPGVAVSIGTPALDLIKTEQVYARAVVPENEIGNIARGAHVQVFVPALKLDVKGVIQVISPVADAASRSFYLKVLLPNPAFLLRPGMLADLHIPLTLETESEIVAIDPQLVSQDANGASIVYVADEKNKKAIRRRVVLGALQNNQVIIVQGLSPEDRLIISGHGALNDGDTIRIVQ